MANLERLSAEESRDTVRRASRMNIIVAGLLVLFVVAVFAFSFGHIATETQPTSDAATVTD